MGFPDTGKVVFMLTNARDFVTADLLSLRLSFPHKIISLNIVLAWRIKVGWVGPGSGMHGVPAIRSLSPCYTSLPNDAVNGKVLSHMTPLRQIPQQRESTVSHLLCSKVRPIIVIIVLLQIAYAICYAVVRDSVESQREMLSRFFKVVKRAAFLILISLIRSSFRFFLPFLFIGLISSPISFLEWPTGFPVRTLDDAV